MNPESADELEAVLALVRLVYRIEMTPAYYRWRFLANPFGPPLVTLLWDGATLAGHYAASPMSGWYRGELPAAQSMTTMTHPDFRNRGVFTSLANDLYARMTELGVKLIWGLPNTQSHYGFRTKLGWRDIALVFTMTRVVGDKDRAGAVEELPAPPVHADTLFDRSDDGRIYPSRRDQNYLRWRYSENPLHTYRFLAPPNSSDVLFVAKEYAPAPNTRALELVECLHASPERFGEFMRDVIGWANSHGFAMVRTWMSLADPAFGQLEKLAFAPREPLAYFGGRTFGSFTLPDTSWSHERFAITMGDSDNY